MISRWALARLLLTALSFTSISVAFASTPDQAIRHWHLYYSPVMLAALSFGVRGALGGSAVAIIAVLSLHSRVESLIRVDSALVYNQLVKSLGQAPIELEKLIAGPGQPEAAELIRVLSLSLELARDRAIMLAGLGILVITAIVVGRLVDIHRAYERELAERANTDGLTGLINRRYFYERLREEVERSRRYGRPFALAMIDLDGLKFHNDTYGHLAGDDLILEAAKKIASCLRKGDIAARYGGDEFSVILLETDEKSAVHVANRLLKSFCETPGANRNGAATYSVTVSIGVAMFPQHGESEIELLRAADDALYKAKSEGGNRISVFEPQAAPSPPESV